MILLKKYYISLKYGFKKLVESMLKLMMLSKLTHLCQILEIFSKTLLTIYNLGSLLSYEP